MTRSVLFFDPPPAPMRTGHGSGHRLGAQGNFLVLTGEGEAKMEINCTSHLKLSVSVRAQLQMPLSTLRPVIGLSLERTGLCVCWAVGGLTPCGVQRRVGAALEAAEPHYPPRQVPQPLQASTLVFSSGKRA